MSAHPTPGRFLLSVTWRIFQHSLGFIHTASSTKSLPLRADNCLPVFTEDDIEASTEDTSAATDTTIDVGNGYFTPDTTPPSLSTASDVAQEVGLRPPPAKERDQITHRQEVSNEILDEGKKREKVVYAITVFSLTVCVATFGVVTSGKRRSALVLASLVTSTIATILCFQLIIYAQCRKNSVSAYLKYAKILSIILMGLIVLSIISCCVDAFLWYSSTSHALL